MGRIFVIPELVLPLQSLYWIGTYYAGANKSTGGKLLFYTLAIIGNLWNYMIFSGFKEIFPGTMFFVPLLFTIYMIKKIHTN